MTDKAWKAAERSVARKLGTRRTPLTGGNSAHTRSDTLHHELFVEVKLRKRPPLWDELLELRVRARAAGREPLLVLERPSGAPGRLLVTTLDTLLRVPRPHSASPAWLLDTFTVEHRAQRSCMLWGLFEATAAQAGAEAKRPLVVLMARGRPGEVAVASEAWWWPARSRGSGEPDVLNSNRSGPAGWTTRPGEDGTASPARTSRSGAQRDGA